MPPINRRAETIMIPVLDVLQAIPVLGFLPGLVLALVALFPRHELGLEMACIIMIFTGQVWNMTFSFHGSLKAIPQSLREVAAIHHLSRWRIFRQLEVPSAMIGLVWNSMMSMAGGWFFLTVTEAFTLKDHDYRLPGIGSYMNEAMLANDVPAMVADVIAMVLMIVFADQVVWRPLVAWSQRFKVEDVAARSSPSRGCSTWPGVPRWLRGIVSVFDASRRSMLGAGSQPRLLSRNRPGQASDRTACERRLGRALKYFLGVGARGGRRLGGLVDRRPAHRAAAGRFIQVTSDWRTVLLALGASFLRTTIGRLAGGGLDAAGRHPHRPLAALVGAVAAGHPGPGQLSRPTACFCR